MSAGRVGGTVYEAPAVGRVGPPFATLLADPPWDYEYWGGKHGVSSRRGQERNVYPTLSSEAICALPVREVAARDSVLLLWATWPKLEDALRVVRAWGYTYKSGLPWLKMSRAACPRVGLGYHVRSCSEPLLIATRGTPGVPAKDSRPLGALFNGRSEHSRKPEAQYDIAEGYPGPWLELFARPQPGLFPPRPGWRFLGWEVDGLDMAEALARLAKEGAPCP